MTTNDLPNLLDHIAKHLRHLQRRAPDLLQSPLREDELQAWFSKFPFELPEEVKAVYRWRNGTRAVEGELLEHLYLFPGFYLLSIEEAHQIYLERKDAPQWREGWFPLFADGAGDFYLIPCGEHTVEAAAVIGFIHGEPEQIVEYETLVAMI